MQELAHFIQLRAWLKKKESCSYLQILPFSWELEKKKEAVQHF